jgi:hypothetical protein
MMSNEGKGFDGLTFERVIMKILIRILAAVFFGVLIVQAALMLFIRMPLEMLAITAFSYGFVFFLIVTIMKRAGRLPSCADEQPPLRGEADVFYIRRSRYRYKGSVCAVVLTEYALVIYGFGRPLLVVARGQAPSIELVKGKKCRFLRILQDAITYEIYVSEPELWKADVESLSERS